jgi:UDP-N-acetylmuramate--alanine ligase
MNLSTVNNVFFIGIGGIGMSALARYFKSVGKAVSGYDKTPSEITSALEDLGIVIHFKDDVQFIEKIYNNTNETLVVYTPAIPKTHSQLNYFMSHRFV